MPLPETKSAALSESRRSTRTQREPSRGNSSPIGVVVLLPAVSRLRLGWLRMRTVNTLTFGSALALLASMLAAGEAEAKSHISVGIAIGAPMYAAPYYPAPPVYYAPPPVYYEPAPVYVPPPPAYYYPPPAIVVPPPASYAPPPAYYAPRPIYWRHGDDEDDD